MFVNKLGEGYYFTLHDGTQHAGLGLWLRQGAEGSCWGAI